MRNRRVDILFVYAITVAVANCALAASEVSWIQGQSCPPDWSIDPPEPQEINVIHFSGPVRFYINRCVAESALGGRPTLYFDHSNKTIELRFDPPARTDCTGFWDPVCGLRGSFGPLEKGQWRFFSTVGGAAFSLDFSVGDEGAGGSICYVDANAPGANDGSSWKDAFLHLQDALAAAIEGGEVRVARGVYKPDQGAGVDEGDRDATFQLKDGVVVKGGYSGWRGTNPNERNIFAFETVLNGDLTGDDDSIGHMSVAFGDYERADNSYHVVTIDEREMPPTLDGFTVTGGIARDSALLDEVGSGGGVYHGGGDATIRNCLIIGNAATYYGGGICSRGPGTLTLIACTLANNWASWAGGAAYCHASNNLVMDRCLVTSNGALYQGAGIAVFGSGQVRVSNGLFSGNRATEPDWGVGGGLYCSLGRSYVSHSTFVENLAAIGSAVSSGLFGSLRNTEVHLSNCIVWGDPNAVHKADQSLFDVTYCTVSGGWPGEGNIDVDPCFIGTGYWTDSRTPNDPYDDVWTEGNYHLRWDSPCVDAGSLQATWNADGGDLDGQPRLSGATVDMGTFELRNDPPLADAGPDVTGFTLDGSMGTVTFDGSRSYDPEGLPLRYEWYYNGQLKSDEVRFSTDFPVGQHRVTLVVSDPTGVSASDEVMARVTLVIGTQAFVSPNIVHRSGGQDIVTLTVLPRGRSLQQFDQTEPVLLFPGGIRATKQSAFTWFSGDVLVMATFRRVELVTAVPTNGPVELRTVGRLTDGQYFSGADTVTIQ